MARSVSLATVSSIVVLIGSGPLASHPWPGDPDCEVAVDIGQAFPGAEGYGAVTAGGRCGKVVVVTDPADYNPFEPDLEAPIPGTLRYAIEEETDQPRTILFNFDPSEFDPQLQQIIKLKRPIAILADDSHLTIAGETAAGGGVVIAEYGLEIRDAHDIIIRHLRFRNILSFGDPDQCPAPDPLGQPLTALGDGIDIQFGERIIIDHVSVAWATDEGIGVEQSEGLESNSITIQNSYVAETLWNGEHLCENPHSRGLVVSDGALDFSVHHNLLLSSNKRNPRATGGDFPGGQVGDLRWNLSYNWGDKNPQLRPDGFGLQFGRGIHANVVGNWLREGPDTDPSRASIPRDHRWSSVTRSRRVPPHSWSATAS